MVAAGRLFYPICATRPGHATARAAVAAMRSVGLCSGFHVALEALALDHAAFRGLMRLWRRIHWSAGDGMMPADQLLAIYRLAATWPGHGDVVELGSWTGLTTSYLATACEVRGDGVVHAVDTFTGTKEGGETYPSIQRFGGSTLQVFRETVRRADIGHRVREHIGYTTDVATRYGGRAIRMLLIDADHSYDGVCADYEAWLPHVAREGLIIFHDTLMTDVARFIDEVVTPDPAVRQDPGPVVPNVLAVTKTQEHLAQDFTPLRRSLRSACRPALEAIDAPGAPSKAASSG